MSTLPKTWPDSDCEFTLRPHELLEYKHHLAVECDWPEHCGYVLHLAMHDAASAARADLLGVWLTIEKPPAW